MRRPELLLALCFALGVPGLAGAEAAGVSDSGVCARCHEREAGLAAASGHAPSLDCLTCHEDRRPGSFGRGHRAVPSCTSHHTLPVETHPEPAHALRPARLRQSCLKCHDPHGSPNAHLIRPEIRVGGRLRPIDFHDAGGAIAGGFVDPGRPGHGLCEVCHQGTKFYPANGHGQRHFTDDCTLCHDHTAAFAPVISDASCAICHTEEEGRLAKANRHHDEFAGRCSSCHAEAKPMPGPGHRLISSCADCHSPDRVATHTPPGAAMPCTQCHEPHGTDNIRLIRDVVATPHGGDRAVHFDDALSGKADGSFASASAPGTGLCETCHTATQFYRADGGGASHFTEPCSRCHPHAAGFLPH